MGMAVVTLKKGEGRLLKSGGMWIFDNEIDTVMGNFETVILYLSMILTDILWEEGSLILILRLRYVL